MSPAQLDNLSPNERRKSYRCAIHGDRRRARLRIGGREIAVEVVDESTEGFSVQVPELLDCVAGQSLLLKTASGWVEVRVMSVFNDEADGVKRTRLGVLRLRDVEESEVEDEAAEPLTWNDLQELMRATFAVLRPMARAGGLFVAAPVIGMVIYFALEHSAPVLEELRDDSAVFVLEGSKGHTRVPTAAPPKIDPPKVDPPVAEAPPTPVAAPEPVEVKHERAVAVLRPERLLEPELARKLDLSAEQKRQLQELFDEFRAAAAAGAGESVESLHELRQRAFEILTETQRAVLARHLESEGQQPSANLPSDVSLPLESN